jgi:hypothetical protein
MRSGFTTSIPSTGGLGRALRGGIAGVATGAPAVVAHVEATGSTPDVGLVALPVQVPAGRERGPVRIIALVGAGQLATHVPQSVPVPHDHSARTADSGALTVFGHVPARPVVVAVSPAPNAR